MAQRDPVRDGAPLLIAAIAMAFLATGGVVVRAAPGVRAASESGFDGAAPAAVPLGRVGSVRTERGGMTQFTLKGPLVAGVLHLGLKPPPRSVLVVEGDQALDPTGRTVEGDVLSMTLKLKGKGGVWVVSGPNRESSLQILAVLDPEGAEPPDVPSPQGFPSDRVLDALSGLSASESPSWFSPTRIGAWLVPRDRKDLPVLPGCVEPITGAGLRICARETLAAIWNCLAHHEMSTRAISGALAIYLDDRLAYDAAQAAASGDACDRVEAMKPDYTSRARARSLIGDVFAADGEAPATQSVEVPPDVSTAHTNPEEGWVREDELSDLIVGLGDSCAGRSLLQALRRSGGTGLNTKVSLMRHELAGSVEQWSGQLPDESDGNLRDAVGALRDLPRGAACDPVVALMALIDEWTARAAEGLSTNGAEERFVDAFREAEKERGGDVMHWLPDRFPVLHAEAEKILRRLD